MTESLFVKTPRPMDAVRKFAVYAGAFLVVALLFCILAYVLIKGVPNITWEFLTTAPSALNKTNGILPCILNTLYMIGITLLFAAPLGIGAAVFLTEYAKRGKGTKVIEFTTETLAGIPSILFGLFGMIFFGETLRLGYSLLTGALTLALMTLPIIVRTTQEALKTVPSGYREGAFGIGASKWHAIRSLVIPAALPGIVTAVILAIGRICGESAALIFTSGISDKMPKDFFSHFGESGATLTVQLYKMSAKGQNEGAFAIAAVLVVLVLTINIVTARLTAKLGSRAAGETAK